MLPDVPWLPEAAVGMRGFNPWQDVLDTVVYNGELSTRGSGRSMHPLIQFGLERNSGTSQLTGRPFSRPVPVLDDMGREIPTAPPLVEHAFRTFAPPQAQLVRDIGRAARGDNVPRYSTGDPLLIEGAQNPNLLQGVGSFFGAPLRGVGGIADVEERRVSQEDRQATRIENYRLEMEAYERQRAERSWPERLIPFGN
jgi:hypothetical protein